MDEERVRENRKVVQPHQSSWPPPHTTTGSASCTQPLDRDIWRAPPTTPPKPKPAPPKVPHIEAAKREDEAKRKAAAAKEAEKAGDKGKGKQAAKGAKDKGRGKQKQKPSWEHQPWGASSWHWQAQPWATDETPWNVLDNRWSTTAPMGAADSEGDAQMYGTEESTELPNPWTIRGVLTNGEKSITA